MRVGEGSGGLGALRAAFEALSVPEQHVLWLTQVEGLAPWEAAERLGISTDELGRLAFVARTELRRRLAAGELNDIADAACQATVTHLPVHALGALPDPVRESVGAHLGACGRCATRFRAIADCTVRLRRATMPRPRGLPAAPSRHSAAAASAAGAVSPGRKRGVGWHRVAVGGAAALLGLTGLTAALHLGPREREPLAVSDPFLADLPAPPATVLGEQVERAPDGVIVPTATPTLKLLAAAPEPEPAPAPPAPAPVAATSTTTPLPLPEPLPPADPLQVDVDLAVAELTLGLGEDGCTGLRLLTISLGCTEPAATDVGVSAPALLGLLGSE